MTPPDAIFGAGRIFPIAANPALGQARSNPFEMDLVPNKSRLRCKNRLLFAKQVNRSLMRFAVFRTLPLTC